MLLVALVIFFFLRNVRATLIPLVTIPLALVGSFALMYAFGFTINTLTLLAMVLAIGLVVDDAIVVLENIYRNVESGMDRVAAAVKGIKEIGFAVVAMTLTLTAVFAPLAFATGRTGRLFIEFALTLAGAVLVSGFVALTLSPMMCSKLLKHEQKHGRIFTMIERWLTAMTNGYARSLAGCWTAAGSSSPCGSSPPGCGVVLLTLLRSELAPLGRSRCDIRPHAVAAGRDRGIHVRATAPGRSMFSQRFPRPRRTTRSLDFRRSTSAPRVLRLKPWEERTRKQQDIARELNQQFQNLPGIIGFAVNPPSLGQSGRSLPVEYVDHGAAAVRRARSHRAGLHRRDFEDRDRA